MPRHQARPAHNTQRTQSVAEIESNAVRPRLTIVRAAPFHLLATLDGWELDIIVRKKINASVDGRRKALPAIELSDVEMEILDDVLG